MSNQRTRPLFLLATTALAALAAAVVPARPASAGGIEVPMQDSRSSGQADAVTADAEGPAAVYYNPACLTLSRGTQVSVGALGLFPNWDYDARGSSANQSMRLPTLLPHVYASTDLGTERFRLGVGINDHFGLNEDWGDKRPLRFAVDKAKLAIIDASVAAAYQVDDHLSLGVALNVYYGEAMLSRNVALGPAPTPEAQFHLRGNDFAVGVTPSLLYKIDDRNQIGAYYRSPFALNMAGDSRLYAPGVVNMSGHTVASIDLPQSVGVGYSVRPTDALRLEADVIWTDWDTFHALTIHSANPTFRQTLPADWRSGFTFRLGGEYKLDPHWTLRAGYAYAQNSVPESTFSPLVPDNNYHLFAAGVGYSTDRWSLDLAYQFIYRETRHIENSVNSPLVDGTWENTFQCLMLTLTVKL